MACDLPAALSSDGKQGVFCPRHVGSASILAAIETLQTDPFKRGSIQLKGEKVRRIRVGDYRIIYEVDTAEAMITVFRVAHRREAYR